tara:strand:- start:1017 stop:1478 length:462 start_codon:yes stop_codon:yes gene_type:complete
MDNEMYCRFSFLPLKKHLVESKAWDKLTKKQVSVFTYLWSCLQWNSIGKGIKRHSVVTNNGKIEVSSIKMGRKLKISKQTTSHAIHVLIEVGFIKLTRVGENKVCHMYKILYDVVPQHQERWRRYPAENWKDECPVAPNKLVGKATRFKSHPN